MNYYKIKYIFYINCCTNILKNIMCINLNCERKNHHYSIKITKKINYSIKNNIIITKDYDK